jgi:uncharacterized membrane protein (UPF0127 family)
MLLYIQYSQTKLINFLLVCLLLASCNGEAKLEKYQKASISLPSGEKIKVYLAISEAQQVNGLSHIKASEFSNSEAMLFYGETNRVRHFWMPNTFFNLDIIFLNEDFYVIDIHRNLQHFPYNGPRESVPTSKYVKCRHVLEMKSSSPIASKILPGMMLKWNEQKTLEQIVSDTRLQQ